MDAKELINWGELSRILAGSRMTIRKNKIPQKHEDSIARLEELINGWLEEITTEKTNVMKTKRELKAERRQELISQKHPGAINFELITRGQIINGETVLGIYVGKNENSGKSGSWITIGNPETGYREIYAKSEIIENQPCVFIEI